MAKYNQEVNRTVSREAAERLQSKLYAAAEQALDLAMLEQKIPAGLLSSCQSILRDADLTPDLSQPDEDDAEHRAAASQWVDDLAGDLGL
jgi:hypothetical protein